MKSTLISGWNFEDLVMEIGPAKSRHYDVAEKNVDASEIFFCQIEGVLRGECVEDDEAGFAEEFADGVDQRGFIVDEQDSGAFG